MKRVLVGIALSLPLFALPYRSFAQPMSLKTCATIELKATAVSPGSRNLASPVTFALPGNVSGSGISAVLEFDGTSCAYARSLQGGLVLTECLRQGHKLPLTAGAVAGGQHFRLRVAGLLGLAHVKIEPVGPRTACAPGACGLVLDNCGGLLACGANAGSLCATPVSCTPATKLEDGAGGGLAAEHDKQIQAAITRLRQAGAPGIELIP